MKLKHTFILFVDHDDHAIGELNMAYRHAANLERTNHMILSTSIVYTTQRFAPKRFSTRTLLKTKSSHLWLRNEENRKK